MVEVVLVPMTPDEFGPYHEQLVKDYAASHVRTGRWTPEVSLELSRKEIDQLLPQGLSTPQHFLYTVHPSPSSGRIGVLWVHVKDQRAFVFELFIDEGHRRKGFGRATMLAAEEIARKRGAKQIALHVFGDNAPARALYAKLGYRETNVNMAKEL